MEAWDLNTQTRLSVIANPTFRNHLGHTHFLKNKRAQPLDVSATIFFHCEPGIYSKIPE